MPPGWRAGMVFLALAATAWAQSAAEVEEIDRLVGESLQLERAGRVRDAIAAMEKALALERRTRDPDHWDVAGSHHRLAGLHEKLKEYETARGHLLRVVEIARRQERAWRRTDARFFLADLDRRRRMTGEELRLLAEAKALNRRKMLLWRAGRYRAALPFVDRVVASASANEDAPGRGGRGHCIQRFDESRLRRTGGGAQSRCRRR